MKKLNFRWQLVAYDMLVLAAVDFFMLGIYRGVENFSAHGIMLYSLISFLCVFTVRFAGNVYQQIWRYGGIQCYIRLLFFDSIGFFLNIILKIFFENVFPSFVRISFSRLVSIYCLNLLMALSIRMIYRYAYKCGNNQTLRGRFLNRLLRIFAGNIVQVNEDDGVEKIRTAIVGAGRSGVALAGDFLANKDSSYSPKCFIDISKEKAGREISGIPVILENDSSLETMKQYHVQEVIFAIPSSVGDEERKKLYEKYLSAGYKIKVYDYPMMQTAGKKRHLRDFDIEELLFRKPVDIAEDMIRTYYSDKVIMITGGGGSIGSELCRQLASLNPKKIVVLDIYENGAYDIQQELRIAYGKELNVCIEICSITNRKGMERVFAAHRPQIVINAAAHKHVPLMEHNCIEAVENNVFGTKILVDLCEEYGAERFMMVSTDKAVNPTNVMGATKRMCEMIVQSASTCGKVKYSATRFGNVLGSAGSVIPLFKKQIANGGPVTLTDKRIIRYFMTIPEASQLVLQSGAMAKNGELFVLDMGQPVKIYDLARNMIRLSGARNVEIIETGLRPGEKLYEELLVKTEELDKTENSLIFVERDNPLDKNEIEGKLTLLKNACETGSDDFVRDVLRSVVPTFRMPEEVNAHAEHSDEMKTQKMIAAE